MLENIKSIEAVEIIISLNNLYSKMNNQWIDFYGLVYKFKHLKTDLGYNDLRLKDNSIIKKSKLVKQMFNISVSLYSRVNSICERFMRITDSGAELLDIYKGYDRTKLIELLQLSSDKLEQAMESNIINPNLSRKELRKVVKELNGEYYEEENITLEELDSIPYTRTIKEHFDKSELKKFSKLELVNLYIDLQKKFEFMKSKKSAPAQKVGV